jgi:uncharacterized protein
MVEVRQATAPAGRPVIDRYGPGGFQVAGQIYTGPLLLLPDRVLPWAVSGFADLTIEDFRLVAEAGGIEILLLGTGARMQRAPKPIRDALRAVGIIVDAMDSGAACRTYGVLSGELRQVAAALLPLRD